MAEGMSYGNRVGHFNYEKELATVVDAILNSTTMVSRLMYMAKPFDRHTLKKTVKVVARSQFQQVSGLESLNSAAENVTVQMQFNRALASMPSVKILAEAFGRQYDSSVDYDAFEHEDILDETLQGLSDAIYTGTGNIVGLDMITDDGTLSATFAGINRNTYTTLQGNTTDFSGTGSLSKLATMYSDISDTGQKERPTVIVTTFDVFDLIESLYLPTVRHQYKTLPVGSKYPMAQKADGMGNGFEALEWRGIPIIRDKAITAGEGFMLNENYLNWHGDNKVPSSFSSFIKKVSMGKSVKEGQATERPSDYAGFFWQEEQMMPNQGGAIGRFWVSGQLVSFQPRRQGRFQSFDAV